MAVNKELKSNHTVVIQMFLFTTCFSKFDLRCLQVKFEKNMFGLPNNFISISELRVTAGLKAMFTISLLYWSNAHFQPKAPFCSKKLIPKSSLCKRSHECRNANISHPLLETPEPLARPFSIFAGTCAWWLALPKLRWKTFLQ